MRNNRPREGKREEYREGEGKEKRIGRRRGRRKGEGEVTGREQDPLPPILCLSLNILKPGINQSEVSKKRIKQILHQLHQMSINE